MNARDQALDQLKIGGDPLAAVAYAIIHLADQFGQQPTHTQEGASK